MRIFAILSTALMFFVASAQSASAYIDPGSGSAIMSAVIGFFVVIGLTIKSFWYKIKSFFPRGKSPEDRK